MSATQSQKRVGLVGYGKLGKFLASKILDEAGHNLELAWVWNRTPETVTSDERVKHLHLADLSTSSRCSLRLISLWRLRIRTLRANSVLLSSVKVTTSVDRQPSLRTVLSSRAFARW